MLDTEYVRSGGDDGRLVIYIYRTGILRSRILQKLEAHAKARGQGLVATASSDLVTTLLGANLFSGIGEYVADVGAFQPRALIEAIVDTAGLRAKANGVAALLVHVDNPLLKDERWAACLQRCNYLEEVALTPGHLDELAWLVGDELGSKQLAAMNRTHMLTVLGAMVDETEGDNLPGFINATKAAYYAGEFHHRPDGEALAAASRIGAAVQSLVGAPSHRSVLELIGAASAQLQAGSSETQIYRALVRGTHRLINRHLKAQTDSRHYCTGVVQTRRLVSWTVLLTTGIQREPWQQLNRYTPLPAHLIPWLDTVAHRYRQVCNGGSSEVMRWIPDPTDSWGRAVTENLCAATVDLLAQLPAKLEPKWLEQVRNPPAQIEDMDLRMRPAVATDIVGHRVALRELRDRVVSGTTATPILLVGPHGVGNERLPWPMRLQPCASPRLMEQLAGNAPLAPTSTSTAPWPTCRRSIFRRQPRRR